jgi:hypothetical protein
VIGVRSGEWLRQRPAEAPGNIVVEIEAQQDPA